jgi:acetyl/propionyl-CoA carboxylase alpha subunit
VLALQVEHGITEMVNGNVDIVDWMLRLQLPEFLKPLDLATTETERSGWSIEVGQPHAAQHMH